MTVEQDIITLLDAHVGLTALVGDRNYFDTLPQQPTYPNTVVHIANTTPTNHLTGAAALTDYYVQIDVRGTTKQSAVSTSIQAVSAMESATTFDCYWLGQTDFAYNDELNIYRRILDFSVMYQFTR